MHPRALRFAQIFPHSQAELLVGDGVAVGVLPAVAGVGMSKGVVGVVEGGWLRSVLLRYAFADAVALVCIGAS